MTTSKRKGVSSQEKTKYAILAHLSDGQEHSSSDIIKTLNPDISNVTVYKYLYKDSYSLVSEGLVERKAGSPQESFRPRYRITEQGQNEYEKQKLKLKVNEEISKEIDKLRKEDIEMMNRMKETGEGITEEEAQELAKTLNPKTAAFFLHYGYLTKSQMEEGTK